MVACGPRLEETLTMLKSAVLFSKKPLHFYIFAEDELHNSFRNAVSILPNSTKTCMYQCIHFLAFHSFRHVFTIKTLCDTACFPMAELYSLFYFFIYMWILLILFLCAYLFLKLDSWPRTVQAKFNFTIYPISFPKENAKEWKKLFKPCASQRLFLPVGLESSIVCITCNN